MSHTSVEERMRSALPAPARLEMLEPRRLLSGPSAREQEMLDRINRFRTAPAQELPLLLSTRNADVLGAMDYFHVNRQVLATQWKSLTAQEPLAWNEALSKAALGHTQKMLAAQNQSHQLPGEGSLLQRAIAAGYANAAFLGENVFAWARSVEHAHAGFAIDWGSDPNGIQSPAGHRDNLMAGVYREVGLSLIDAPPDKAVGPLLVTQNFGARRDQGKAYLLGTVFDDKNRNGTFNAGEGLANVTVVAAGKAGVFSTNSMTAGGYQMQLPPGTYALTAAGAGGYTALGTITVGTRNLKRDVVRSSFTPDTSPPSVVLNRAITAAGGTSSLTFDATYTDAGAVNFSSLGKGDIYITGPGGAVYLPELIAVNHRASAPSITATYRFDAPGGIFDSFDNGIYTLTVLRGQVSDASGRFIPTRFLSGFGINLPPAVLTPGGNVIINGTAGNDVIGAWRDTARVWAKVNGKVTGFDAARVKRIIAQGFDGNDVITLGRNLVASRLDGGAGNDTLYGTDGGDTLLGQAGDDLIYGYAGNDVFLTRIGRDTLFGGMGFDTAQTSSVSIMRELEKVG